jgi:hypothetical protein
MSKERNVKKSVFVVVILALGSLASAQPPQPQEHKDEPHSTVETRGDKAMGFSHEKTTHHFLLYKDGGAIEVAANDAKDTGSRDMIRMHLSHIARMFAGGNFDAPMFIHDTTPPGVPVMTELRDQIKYRYEETDAGGRVRIQTINSKALEAVHAFLRFQITEHKTGDAPEIRDQASGK